MAKNLPSRYERAATVATRASEITAASFITGTNAGAANSGCIGICTGNANPKADDFSRSPLSTNEAAYIGGSGLGAGNASRTKMLVGSSSEPSFLKAAADVAVDADLGGGYLNKTGVVVKANQYAWGVK